MLHLAGGIPLGVDVRDLLQLQRAFERDRVVNAPAQEKEVAARVKAVADLLNLLVGLEDLFDQQRQVRQRVQMGLPLLRTQRALHPRQVQREQVERHQLRGEGLGGGDANLRARVRVDDARRTRA